MVETKDGIPYFVNEFWTSRQRQVPRIHEVSYRACFKPQLPAFFIKRFTKISDIVYGPFMGRGTTPVEAALCGRVPYGNDTHPLSFALTEPRVHSPTLIKINEKRKQVPPLRDVAKLIEKRSRILLSQGLVNATDDRFFPGQSDETPSIPDASIALAVTSTPFLDLVDYEADNWLRCRFLGIDPKTVQISKPKTVEGWQMFIQSTMKELARITRSGGYIAFEVGEIRKGSIRLEENVIAAAKGLSVKVMAVMINQQNFTKISNCWGVSNNDAGTNSNRIVILKKIP